MNRKGHPARERQLRRGRLILKCLVTALVVLVFIPAVPASYAAAAKRVDPKVVIIVGPSGDVTQEYRALADDAAAAARRYTSSVTTLYSPAATWPRVRAALQGASVVVYLGHGNGWPSRYRSEPWPYSENGFGLNIVGSPNDVEHQYFGEYYLAREVKLAPNATVVLSHLCYASGNSEPGLPEDGLVVAVQRVDNYAAGFIAAGASAVIADGHLGPAAYVDGILGTQRSVLDIWRSAPTFHDNVVAVDSTRSPGNKVYLDPDVAGAGFYRSLALRPGLRAGDIVRGATGRKTQTTSVTLGTPGAGPPAAFGGPAMKVAPTAGATLTVALPIVSGRDRLPAGVTLLVRWDPLLLADPSLAPLEWAGSLPVGPPVPTAANVTDNTSPASWIVPERPGEVVLTEIAKLGKSAIQARVLAPQVRGLYRLTMSLADRDGVELSVELATQPLPWLVRVGGRVAVAYDTALVLDAVTGQPVELPVGLANTGADPLWVDAAPGTATDSGTLTARWISLEMTPSEVPAPEAISLALLVPGASVAMVVDLIAPPAPGQYLVMLDILRPDGTSLAAAGVPPYLVRATVANPNGGHRPEAAPVQDPSVELPHSQ